MDSTPIYDAVSTQDTVTQLRSAIRKLLRALEGSPVAQRVRAVLVRDDDYASAGKPPCDWDDRQAREARDFAARPRVELCERLEKLQGERMLDELEVATAEWEGMPALDDRGLHDELTRRFERAARACQKRHAEWKDIERRRSRLRAVERVRLRLRRMRPRRPSSSARSKRTSSAGRSTSSARSPPTKR